MRRRPPFRGLVFCSVIACFPPAYATEVGNANAERAVVWLRHAKLAAFAQGDAGKAFDLATVPARSLAGTPNDLLRMIEKRATPSFRHHDALFSEMETSDGRALRAAQSSDDVNSMRIAIHQLEIAAGAGWTPTIASCSRLTACRSE